MGSVPGGPQRIVILGGGCGALSAAFHLTRERDWQSRYEITVYQIGWRLGGKCATGRNKANRYRIEEHGLHVFGGFYDYTFRMMRECYAAMNRRPGSRLAEWRDAFSPQSHVTLMEKGSADSWYPWNIDFPAAEGEPGDSVEPPGFWTLLYRLAKFLEDRMQVLSKQVKGGAHGMRISAAIDSLSSVRRMAGELADREIMVPPTERDWWRRPGVSHVEGHYQPTEIIALTEKVSTAFRAFKAADFIDPESFKHFGMVLEVGLAIIRGLLLDQVYLRGFEAIDDCDFWEWLHKHGAACNCGDSAVVRPGYDYAFGYIDGDVDRRAMAAGAALHAFLRLLLTYRGALFWEMQAGMGEVVFVPLYDVLKRRGVRFEFFHRVDALRIGRSGDQRFIDAISMGQQMRTKGDDEYQPLITVKGLPCWPSEPLYDQLERGDELEAVAGCVNLEQIASRGEWEDDASVLLERGRDFDTVILGIPIGDLERICHELIVDLPDRWGNMVTNVETVATQAMQIWLNLSAAEVGWKRPRTILTGFAQPFNTWADMTFLGDREEECADIRSIAYFCGPFPEPSNTQTRPPSTVAEQNGKSWFQENIRKIWPDYPLTLNEETGQFVEPNGYYRANVNPPDRYVLSLPGTTRYRLRADESGYENLYLAGDWVRSGYNIGCAESAVLAGVQAAAAIEGDCSHNLVGMLVEEAAEFASAAIVLAASAATLGVAGLNAILSSLQNATANDRGNRDHDF